MDKKMQEAVNDQMNFELYSSYIYMAMSSYLKSLNLNGFANWLEVQVREEITHGMKFYHYLHERGADVVFQEVPKPKTKWDSVEAVFQNAYDHEQIVTSRIHKLVDMAHELKDHATTAHLQWFVTEQVEEEASTLEILQKIKLVAGSPHGLLILDQELGQRTFNPPQSEE